MGNMKIGDMTLSELKGFAEIAKSLDFDKLGCDATSVNPMVGRHCIIRTYSAGVHMGMVQSVDGQNVHLTQALRLWRWTDGGLSLSAMANEGMMGGRVDRTGEIFLTQAIEIIPVTKQAWASYEQYVEKHI